MAAKGYPEKVGLWKKKCFDMNNVKNGKYPVGDTYEMTVRCDGAKFLLGMKAAFVSALLFSSF